MRANRIPQSILNQVPRQIRPEELGPVAAKLRDLGVYNADIASLYGVSERTVRRRLKQIGYKPKDLLFTAEILDELGEEETNNFGILELLELESTADLILCDPHLPTTRMDVLNQAVAEAKEFGVKRCIIAGDLLNAGQINRHDDRQGGPEAFDREVEVANEVMKRMLTVFDEIVILLGNHDENMIRNMGYVERFPRALRRVLYKLTEEEQARIQICDRDRVDLLTDAGRWIICHTRQYSVNPFTVPKGISLTEEAHVWGAHRHHHGVTYSPSGRIIVEGGWLGDDSVLAYKKKYTTTHPKSQLGYGFLFNGLPYLPLLAPLPPQLRNSLEQ